MKRNDAAIQAKRRKLSRLRTIVIAHGGLMRVLDAVAELTRLDGADASWRSYASVVSLAARGGLAGSGLLVVKEGRGVTCCAWLKVV